MDATRVAREGAVLGVVCESHLGLTYICVVVLYVIKLSNESFWMETD